MASEVRNAVIQWYCYRGLELSRPRIYRVYAQTFHCMAESSVVELLLGETTMDYTNSVPGISEESVSVPHYFAYTIAPNHWRAQDPHIGLM